VKDGKFEVGDRVKVKKPKKQGTTRVGWVPSMDRYDGYIIGYVHNNIVHLVGCRSVFGDPWYFDVSWLELAGSTKGMCQDCGGEMKDVQLLTSTTKICPKCKK
jgi:hypothetical protein